MERIMKSMPFRRFQGMFACTVVLAMLILMTACSGISSSSNSQPATGSTATTSSPTLVPTVAPTQPPTSTSTPSTVAFKPGGISFIGPVKTITSSSLVMSAPNGKTYTLAINAQTDRSAYSGGLPAVGASVDMDSVINPDGSLTATILKPAVPGDPDLNVIANTGITTSAVGADRVIHFTAGNKSYTYTIPATADLSAYGGNAQAIGINATVKVKVSYPANTVVSITNPNG